MRLCAFCGKITDADIGMYQELKTHFWGGKRTGIEYSPKLVSFFCTDEHRSEFLSLGGVGEFEPRRVQIED